MKLYINSSKGILIYANKIPSQPNIGFALFTRQYSTHSSCRVHHADIRAQNIHTVTINDKN